MAPSIVAAGMSIDAENASGRSEEAMRDELLLALAHSRRRWALYSLYESDGTLTLWDVAAAVAEAETGTPRSALASKEIEQVQLSLYHCHVPKLADVGLVELDDSEFVVLTDLGLRLEPRLREFVAPGERPLVPDL